MTEGKPTGTGLHPIVQFMLSEPGIVERLLAEHVDDGTGHCRVCTAGPQAGRQKFPCRLREFAEQASDVSRRSAVTNSRSAGRSGRETPWA